MGSRLAGEKGARRDETILCARCGVSFLWTLEEQSDEQPAPEHCWGCRILLPDSDRERGLVKWYHRRKGYGFIQRSDGTEIFTHRSRFQGFGHLRSGDLIEFSLEESPKGPIAVHVSLLQRVMTDESTDG